MTKKDNSAHAPEATVAVFNSKVLGHYDSITLSLSVIDALIDSATVLSALVEAPDRTKLGEMAIGNGMAGGYELAPSTISKLLCHANSLLHEMKKEANGLFEHAMARAKS